MRYASWFLVLSVFISACGDNGGDITEPTTGSIEVTTTTTGETSATEYTVSIDGQASEAIGINASLTREGHSAGTHSVLLGGLPDGCTVSGANPRSVTVTAGETAVADFAITCVPPVGAIRVAIGSVGPAPASYELMLDGVNQGPVGSTSIQTLEAVSVGSHLVGLSVIPANCQLQGQNPQSTTVAFGETANVAFALICTQPPAETGSLSIGVTTTGAEVDPDGYTIAVDGGTPQLVEPTGTTLLTNVAVGAHTVQLSGIAANCTVAGANPQSVTVTASSTAAVSFLLTCTSGGSTTGGIRIVTSTTGTSPDADGYTFSLDGAAAQLIGNSATVEIAGQPAGSHTLQLGGVASNCSLADENPRTFSVTAGTTVEVQFTVTCVSTNVLQWTRMESGSTASLSDVWGSGPRDVYVTGGDTGPTFGVVLHYDGQSWSLVHRSAGSLFGVWASAPNDVFAVGYEILHYDGTEWATMAGPDLPGNAHYHAVWGTSSSNVYAVGDYFTDVDNLLIIHYDGSTWSVVDLGPRIAQVGTDVHGTSASDVYVTGFAQKAPPYSAFALHYDGTSWSQVLSETGLLYSIWANAPNDVFAGGVDGGFDDQPGIIRHYDGQNWTQTPVSTYSVGSLWGASASDVYAAGGRVFHFDGNAWSGVFDEGVAAVWGASASDVFMVGSGGLILHGTQNRVADRGRPQLRSASITEAGTRSWRSSAEALHEHR